MKKRKRKWPKDYRNRIIKGDCLKWLKKIPDNSVTAVVTDPPYSLGFMGKHWDKALPDPEIWKELLRVCKPGAPALIFGGTRTFHRLACAVEDAGWLLKDTLCWTYGSGFPKSLDISKSLDQKANAEREIIGPAQHLHSRGKTTAFPKRPTEKTVEESGRKTPQNRDVMLTAPATKEAKLWNGYGSALKPAFEPILYFVKPLDGTYAANALRWGVAGLNIDGGRIKTLSPRPLVGPDRNKGLQGNSFSGGIDGSLVGSKCLGKTEQGRWPANLLLTHHPDCTDDACDAECPVRMLDEQSGVTKPTAKRESMTPSDHIGVAKFGYSEKRHQFNVGDSGGASRFFYCGKASKRERGEFNTHATIKPLKLMKYLIKLVTMPEKNLIVDPFAGSGTTALACYSNHVPFVCFEREPEYVEIARRRLQDIKEGDGVKKARS